MSKSIIQEKQFWRDSVVPQFLKSQDIEDHLERRRKLVKAFPLVYAAVFGDLTSSADYDEDQHADLYRRFNLVKGILQGVNNQDDALAQSTADLLRKHVPGTSGEPKDYGIVAATIWDVDFPRL